MSLYRNWRPRSFTDLVGQDTVVRTLSQALTSGRLVHAYLFSGPRGSGKTSAAKIFARCITCTLGPTPSPDNECEHCRAILDGTALDVVEIDAASNRGIDEIRALRDAVKFAPSTMRKKVYIIDEAHMLTKEGANAFLKTLEEPPPHAVFVLATTAPESLPVTILSRCQRFAFRRIPTAVMVERMRRIADAENIAIDDDALSAIAYRADGGLRDALTMLEQASSFAQGTIDLATIEAAFGSSGRVFAQTILDAFIASDATAVLRAIEEASDAGTEMSNLIRSLIAELRHVVIARIDSGLLAGDLVEDDARRVMERANMLPQARALRALRLLADALAQARTSGSPRLELESAMLRLTLQGEDPTLEALSNRVKQLEEQLAGGTPAVASPARPAAPPPATKVTAAPKKTAAKEAAIAAVPPAVTAPPTSAPAATAPEKSAPPAAMPERSPSPAFAVSASKTVAAGAQPVTEFAADETMLGADPASASPGPDVRPVAPPAPDIPPVDPPAAAKVAPAPPPEPMPEPAAAAASNEPPTLQRTKSLWPNIVARAEGKAASLRGPLSRTSVIGVNGWTIQLEVADEYNAGILRSRQAMVDSAVAEVLGPQCTAGISVGSGTRQRKAKNEADDQAEASLGLLDYAAKRLGI